VIGKHIRHVVRLMRGTLQRYARARKIVSPWRDDALGLVSFDPADGCWRSVIERPYGGVAIEIHGDGRQRPPEAMINAARSIVGTLGELEASVQRLIDAYTQGVQSANGCPAEDSRLLEIRSLRPATIMVRAGTRGAEGMIFLDAAMPTDRAWRCDFAGTAARDLSFDS
jgi:hypothetical protein